MHPGLVNQMLKAPEDQIRAILMSLCADKSTRDKAVAEYSKLLTEDKSGNALKRKAGDDLFFCLVCETSFSASENKEGSCVYHEGECEMDESADIWQELDMYDEWRNPPEEELLEEWPQGFKWSCCGKPGDALGCCRDKHDATDGVKRLKEESHSNKIADIVNLVSDDEEN